MLKSRNLWTVYAHATAKENWVLLVDGDVELFLIGNPVSLLSMFTQEFCLLKFIAFKSAYGSENLTCIFQELF